MATITQTGNNPDALEQPVTPAVVTIGDIPPTNSDGKFEPDEMQDPAAQYTSIWLDYAVVNKYEKDNHRWMMGITSPDGFQGDSVAFVQTASPTLLWVADWTASKTGEVPNVPDAMAADPSWVLLDERSEPAMIELALDGVTPIYRISGTYVFGKKNPNAKLIRDVNFPLAPWVVNGVYPRLIDDANLDGAIL